MIGPVGAVNLNYITSFETHSDYKKIAQNLGYRENPIQKSFLRNMLFSGSRLCSKYVIKCLMAENS